MPKWSSPVCIWNWKIMFYLIKFWNREWFWSGVSGGLVTYRFPKIWSWELIDPPLVLLMNFVDNFCKKKFWGAVGALKHVKKRLLAIKWVFFQKFRRRKSGYFLILGTPPPVRPHIFDKPSPQSSSFQIISYYFSLDLKGKIWID